MIVADPAMSAAFEAIRSADPDLAPKEVANLVSGDYARAAKAIAERTPDGLVGRASGTELADLVRRVVGGEISRANAREVLDEHLASGRPVGAIVEARGFRQISDTDALASHRRSDVIADNPKAVADYRAGKPTIGFLVGQVMKATGGQANAALVGAAVRRTARAGVRGMDSGRTGLMGAVSAVLILGGAILVVIGLESGPRPVEPLPRAQGPGREHRPLRGLAGRHPRRLEDRRVGRHGDPPAPGPDRGARRHPRRSSSWSSASSSADPMPWRRSSSAGPRSPTRPGPTGFLEAIGGRSQARRGELVDVLEPGSRVRRRARRRRVPGCSRTASRPDAIELSALVADPRGIGAGSALVDPGCGRATVEAGRRRDLGRDDERQPRRAPLLPASRVRDRRGQAGAVDRARTELKPTIGRIGEHGIPIRDEIELVLDHHPHG